MKSQAITVLGAGAWGAACAQLLAENGHRVRLWSYEKDVSNAIEQTRINHAYLPQVVLSERIAATHDLAQAIAGAEIVFQAIPVAYLRSVLKRLTTEVHTIPSVPWVSLSKGIEIETGFVPTEIIQSCISVSACAVLSGPSYAQYLNVVQGTAIGIASDDAVLLSFVKKCIENNTVFLIPQHDSKALQYQGAFKNVITIALSCMQAAGVNDNAQMIILACALQELKAILQYKQCSILDMYTLPCLGDIVLSTYGALSKNKRFGQLLGQGLSLEAIKLSMGQFPEGFNTIQALCAHMPKEVIPLTYGLHAYMHQRISFDHYREMIMHAYMQKLTAVVPEFER